MALIDVKEYYLKLLDQYQECKDDLAEFEAEFKKGNISEDKLEYVKEDVARLRVAVDTQAYTMYLLELPKNPKKRKQFINENGRLVKYFKSHHVDDISTFNENTSILAHLRQELKKIEQECIDNADCN